MYDNSSNQRGYSLLELMIVVAIVAVLASLAYPSYQQYVQRTNQADAQSFLLEVSSREHQYILDNRGYGTLAAMGVTASNKVNTNYTVTVVVDNSAAPPTFTVTATPVAGSPQAGFPVLTINHLGQKTPVSAWP